MWLLSEHGKVARDLKPWTAPAQYRWNVYKGIRNAIEQNEGGLEKFSQGVRRHVRSLSCSFC